MSILMLDPRDPTWGEGNFCPRDEPTVNLGIFTPLTLMDHRKLILRSLFKLVIFITGLFSYSTQQKVFSLQYVPHAIGMILCINLTSR